MKDWMVLSCALITAPSSLLPAQKAPSTAELPYAAVHDPEFISAEDATFMSADDRVIGLMDGAIAKAYPAAILSQHGLVEDRSRYVTPGAIAITW